MYYFGARYHAPWLGRFISVDPKAVEFIHQSSYVFADNDPVGKVDVNGEDAIKMVDPLGEVEATQEGEPIGFASGKGTPDNPITLREFEVFPNDDPPPGVETIDFIYELSGGDAKYASPRSAFEMGMYLNANEKSFLGIDFTGNDSNDKYSRYVNENNVLLIYDSALAPKDFVNFMFGNMIYGNGAENYAFPLDGQIGRELLKGIYVQNALVDWWKTNYDNIKNSIPTKETIYDERYDAETFGDFAKNWGILNVSSFIGSATVKISQLTKDKVIVSVFNITSITSGDLLKHLPTHNYSGSIPRIKDSIVGERYSNISQHFTFTVYYSEIKEMLFR